MRITKRTMAAFLLAAAVAFPSTAAELSTEKSNDRGVTGGEHIPVAWDGAAPGGHHREGILRFKPVTPQPAAIELRITRSGETSPRSFRWRLQ